MARLQDALDLEPALEVVHVPPAHGQENGNLRKGPPLDARVLLSVNVFVEALFSLLFSLFRPGSPG